MRNRIERSYEFDEDLFNNVEDNTNIDGFFQSEKYFKHIESEIREDFEFVDGILEPCKEMVSELDNPIALHIRRTDYLTDNNHTTLDIEYYETALKEFDDDRQVIVFSDEPQWCNEQEIFSDDRFLISESNDNAVDMCLMSLCTGHIIANSSFSWWGAWLARKSEKVIAPIKWFGPGNKTKDTSDLIPERWTRI